MMLWNHGCLLLIVWFASLQTTKAMYNSTNGSNPEFQTIMFDESKSFRQDMCHLHSQYYNKTIELADALQGLNLSSVFACPNAYCKMKGKELDLDDPGIFVILLDEVADRAGFHWRDNYALTDENQMGDKGFDDLLAWSVKTYDIAASWWTETTARIREGIDFPKGWYEADIILVGKTVEDKPDFEFDAFLLPFTIELWTMILVTVVISGLVYYTLEILDDRTSGVSLEKSRTKNVSLACASFTGRLTFHPGTKVAWLFSLSLAFWAMIVGVSYTANLASAFVVKNSPGLQIQSVHDAVAHGYKICVWNSTAADTILKRDFSHGRFVRKGDEKGALKGILDGECNVAAISKGSWDTQKQDPAIGCELEWIGRKYKEIPAGFATRHDSGTLCSSLISEVLSIHIRDMIDEGFVEEKWQEHIKKFESQGDCMAEKNDEDLVDKQRLTLKGLGGIFIVHGAICIFVVVYTLIVKYTCAEKANNQAFVKNLSEYTEDMSDRGKDNPSLSATSESRSETHGDLREMRQQIASILNLLQQQRGYTAVPAAAVPTGAASYPYDGVEC